MKDQILAKLSVYENEDGKGYDTKEIEKAMPKELYEAFSKWFSGQTGLIIDGRFCVFTYDLERYLTQREEALRRTGVAKIS